VITALNRLRRRTEGAWRERGMHVERDLAYGPDPDQRLDAWIPPSPHAAVLLLHGGGWIEGSRVDFASLAPRFAARGLLAVAVDYRLAGRHPWPAALEDVTRAIAFLAPWCDPKRVLLWGHSAGGHIALMHARLRPAGLLGVVALGAPADLRLLRGAEVELADRVFRTKDLAAVSPICVADRAEVPTLLVHGTADVVCDISGARALAAQPGVRLLEVPGGNHGLQWPPGPCLRARAAAMRWVEEVVETR
jgi:acetyl esterase/lipase